MYDNKFHFNDPIGGYINGQGQTQIMYRNHRRYAAIMYKNQIGSDFI